MRHKKGINLFATAVFTNVRSNLVFVYCKRQGAEENIRKMLITLRKIREERRGRTQKFIIKCSHFSIKISTSVLVIFQHRNDNDYLNFGNSNLDCVREWRQQEKKVFFLSPWFSCSYNSAYTLPILWCMLLHHKDYL